MADPSPQPIVWKDGVLIAPQHFQQQDRYHGVNLHARLTAVSPHTWGVAALTLDDAALRNGQVHVAEFRGVLPDGLVASFRGGDPGAPSPRPLAEHFPATARSLDVALGVPLLRDGIENFTGNEFARYRTIVRGDVPDLTSARSKVDVEVGQPNLSLLLGSEAQQGGLASVKIGEVVRDAGGYTWSPTYVPPCLSLAVSRHLCNGLRELLGVAVGKRRALVELRRERDGEVAEFLARDITHYLLLDALGTNIPVLRHFVDTPSSPPLAAYLALLQFAGTLTNFATQVDPAELPAFNYLDLRASFDELLRQIRAMLGLQVRDKFVRIPLSLRREDGMWLGRLADEGMLGCSSYILAVESTAATLPAAELIQTLPRLSKIASWKRIYDHIKLATPGVRVRHLPAAPPELPTRPRQAYFSLNTSDPDWRSITSERTIAAFFPDPFEPEQLRVELFGILQA
jgi:type VI secretion system protein ImpJ